MASGEPVPVVVDLREARGVQIGDGNTQINVFPPRVEVLRPWMAPALTGPVTDRPNLYAALSDAVLREGTGPTTLTAAIEGAGGFGKTTLATMLCHDSRVAAHFTGGLLWVTVGERNHGAQIAELVGGLCEVLSGEPVTTANPQAAGGRLGELLDARERTLLVVDDVWRPEQLAPFMIGGKTCRRLITTRNVGVAPRTGTSVLVDAMTTEEAVATLAEGVGGIPRDLLDRLVAGTGRWPLLLSLTNATLLEQIGAGADVEQAVRWVLLQMEAEGPTVFDTDLGDEVLRSQAVEATMAASLALLPVHHQDRYLDLAIVPEDTLIPAELLSRLWHSAGLPAGEAERLRAALVRLRLVQPGWTSGQPAVRLHDVLSSYLRHRLPGAEIARRHATMIRTAEGLLPSSDPAWWSLPADAHYLWHHLPYHLVRAGRSAERDALALDLRWVAAKAAALASSVPVEADLAEVPGGPAQSLRRALGTISELLAPGDPPNALGATLYAYLNAIPALAPVVEAYQEHLSSPQLVPVWPLPDRPGMGMLRTLKGHNNGVSHCAFSPDGNLIATASHDQTVRLWETATGRTVHVLTGHTGAVSSCAFSPDGTRLVTASHDQTVRLWDVAGQERKVLSGHSGPVTACRFSPDGGLLATAGFDQKIRLWDPATWTITRVLAGHSGPLVAVEFSPDGSLLATAGHDQTVRLWNVGTGRQHATLSGHSGPVTSCAFSPDGRRLATGGDDGTVHVWDIATGQSSTLFTGHEASVLTCVFSPNGELVASGGRDLTARVWNAVTGEEQALLSGHSEAVTSCAFTPDGTLLATASHDWKVHLWPVDAELNQSPSQVRWEYVCEFSPDGGSLATAGYDRTIRLWDVATGEVRSSLHGHSDSVSGCAFSPDGALLATASHDRTIRVWDTGTGETQMILSGHTDEVSDCAFSPDGTLIASAAHDDTIRLWDAHTGQLVQVLSGHEGAVSACAFAPDGTTLVSASHDHTARLWDIDTGTTRAVLYGHENLVSNCAFSQDGTHVTTASHDRKVKIWEATTGALVQTLNRHTSGVTVSAFAPDGSVTTADIGERRIRMWRLGSDTPWCGFRVVTPLMNLAWHPDQPLLCAVGESGVYLFRYLPNGVRDGARHV